MLVKMLILKSLPYIVGVASSAVAVHAIVPTSSTGLGSCSYTSTEIGKNSTQIVNRSLKSDRLPIKHPQTNKELPARTAPNPGLEVKCKPPMDVVGRCFAGVKLYYQGA